MEPSHSFMSVTFPVQEPLMHALKVTQPATLAPKLIVNP